MSTVKKNVFTYTDNLVKTMVKKIKTGNMIEIISKKSKNKS